MIRDSETCGNLAATIRRFVRERLMPAEAAVEASNRIEEALIEEVRRMGLFGLSIPEDHGGLGLTMEEEVLIGFELGYTSPAFRSLIGTNNGIGSQGIVADGTDEQKAYWLPKLATGEVIGSFALTEPDVGSDAGSVRTTARREGDEYVISGTKRYITNAPVASVFTLMARTGGPGPSGVTAFLVERDRVGLNVGKPDHKMGQRGTQTCDVYLDNVRVPATNILGVEGGGFKTAMKVLNRGRLHIASVCIGVSQRLIDESVSYAKTRTQFGKPIGEHQMIQAMLADMGAESYAGRSMVLEAARAFDERSERMILLASSCKLFCSEMVGRVADRAVQIHGGAGYMQEYAVEHFYRDVRLFRLYEGTSEIQRIIIARELMKEADL